MGAKDACVFAKAIIMSNKVAGTAITPVVMSVFSFRLHMDSLAREIFISFCHIRTVKIANTTNKMLQMIAFGNCHERRLRTSFCKIGGMLGPPDCTQTLTA